MDEKQAMQKLTTDITNTIVTQVSVKRHGLSRTYDLSWNASTRVVAMRSPTPVRLCNAAVVEREEETRTWDCSAQRLKSARHSRPHRSYIVNCAYTRRSMVTAALQKVFEMDDQLTTS